MPQSPSGPAERPRGRGGTPDLELLSSHTYLLPQAAPQGPALISRSRPVPPTTQPHRGLSRGSGKRGEGRPASGLVPISGSPEAHLSTVTPRLALCLTPSPTLSPAHFLLPPWVPWAAQE